MDAAFKTRRSNGSSVRATVEVRTLHRALCRVVRDVGATLLAAPGESSEGTSILGDHVASRWDLISLGLIIDRTLREFAAAGLAAPAFETEESVLLPPAASGSLRLVVDPIDGTKAWDNYKAAQDCPLAPPSSAVSMAALCPATGRILASVVYAFDLQEVFSALWTGSEIDGPGQYFAFRNDTLLNPVAQPSGARITARRRVLHVAYAAADLCRLAEVDQALARAGLAPSYGGHTGSSATDIVNVIRGSFCGYVDVRALVGVAGAQLKFYDVAGIISPAISRGLFVRLMDHEGQPLKRRQIRHDTPVGIVVAYPDVADRVVDALAVSACSDIRRMLATSVAPTEPSSRLLQ